MLPECAECRKHDELEAERLFRKGLKKTDLDADELCCLRKNNPGKKVIAWYIRKQTSVRNEWIAKQLEMGNISNMSQYIREVEEAKEGLLWKLKKILK